ncbi:MAG TPA: XRE family transcriptional regulator [Aurantimonas coralicida]|uniref:XRE family transcriptional regulator n=2 Tax=root TaxID=1 RepID=A0A9C9TH04_9HYPH|nr:XRE family transcriptional regulator [Aurantimonas coralicida]HEU00797.1 XRE family transcriptional regulator [Aurantimonas coralicida]
MDPEAFRTWRKSLGLKQKDAAERLGLKKRVIQYYEKGHRDGKAVEIPKTVELACLALSLGYDSYDGGPLRGTAAKEKSAPVEA